MNLIKTTEEILKKHGQLKIHAKRMPYWIKQIDPQASEIVLVAALAHDIGRAILFGKALFEAIKSQDGNDSGYLRHQREGAELIHKELIASGVDVKTASEVAKIVEYHERGGWYEADLVKDADSLSFFETNAPKFLTEQRYLGLISFKMMRKKFNWMYSRITIEKAKELAKPMHEKVMRMLDEKETNAQ